MVTRQILQSIWQFAVVLVAQLMVLPAPPADLTALWTPVLMAMAAALAIWGGAKAHDAATSSGAP